MPRPVFRRWTSVSERLKRLQAEHRGREIAEIFKEGVQFGNSMVPTLQ